MPKLMSSVRRYAAFLLAAIILFWPFFLASRHVNLQGFTDFFINGRHHALSALYAWNSTGFGGNTAGEIWRAVPLGAFYEFFLLVLKIPANITQTLLLTSIFAASFLCSYTFIKELIHKEEGALPDIALLIASLFYVFNPYTVTQITQSYLLVIPYLFLPTQLLLLIRGLKTGKVIKYGVLIALVNSVVFGMNLVFGVIAIFALLALGLWLTVVTKRYRPKHLLLLGLTVAPITILLILFWIAPQAYSSLIDHTTTQSILQSESFYNNDSSVSNILRGLGDWSFFSGNNGVPYNSFSHTYKDNPFVILAGYFFIASSVTLYLMLGRVKAQKTRSTTLFFLIMLLAVLPFIGGTHASWPTHTVMAWLFQHVPYFMVFRNTYKFASLEMLSITALLAVALGVILSGKKRLMHIMAGAILVLVAINAFPFFTGQLFSVHSEIDRIPPYWQEAAKYVNNTLSNSEDLFMLPDQYFETLDWPDGQKSFQRNLEETLWGSPVVHDTCKGCGQYYTSNFISYAYQNLTNPNIFPLLGMVGVSDVVQRNDFDYQYYKVQSPSEIKSILAAQPSVQFVKSIGKLDFYKINKKYVYPLFYSPGKIVSTGKVAELPDVVGQRTDSTRLSTMLLGQIQPGDAATKANTNLYKRVFDLDETHLSGSKATNSFSTPRRDSYTFSPNAAKLASSLSYRVGYTYAGGDYQLVLSPIQNNIRLDGRLVNPTPANVSETKIDLGNYGASSIAAELNSKAFLLPAGKSVSNLGTLQLNTAATTVNVYSADTASYSNVAVNGSFENGLWQPKVQDCRQTQPNADIKMSLVSGNATNGTKSLQLSSKQDSACTYSPPLTNFTPGVYLFSIDFKNITGSSPAYCVWNGRGCVSYAELPKSGQWQGYTQAVKLGADASNMLIYLYAPRGNYAETINQYDNIRIYKVGTPLRSVGFTLPDVDTASAKLDLPAGSHTFSSAVVKAGANLVDNGSFQSGLWSSEVNDCSGPKSATSGIGMRRIKTGGGYAAELTSTADTACTTSDALNQFSDTSLYGLSINYRIVSGTSAHVCVWDGHACVLDKVIPRVDGNWHNLQQVVQPGMNSQSLSVFLYASGGRQNAKIDYSDIQMRTVENNFLNTYTLASATDRVVSPAQTSFTKITPTQYVVHSHQTKEALIVFQQSYHPGWRAYVVAKTPKGLWQGFERMIGLWKQYQIPASQHIVANGFENGWWVNPQAFPASLQSPSGDYTMIIEYWPQRLVWAGLGVGGLTLVGCFGYLYVVRKSGRKLPREEEPVEAQKPMPPVRPQPRSKPRKRRPPMVR